MLAEIEKLQEMKLQENLISLRKARHMSQEAVSDAIGITSRTYQNYEYGSRVPPLSTLIALADLYDVSLDELVCRKR